MEARASCRLATFAHAISKDEAHCAQKDHQGLFYVAYLRLLHWRHRYALVLVHPLGVGLAKTRADDLHLGLGGFERNARLQASGGRQIMTLVGAVRIGLQGYEYIRRRIGLEGGRQNSHHRSGLAAYLDGRTHQPQVAAQAPAEELIADHRDLRPVRDVLVGREGPAERGRDAEDPKELGRNMDAFHLLGMVTATDVHSRADEVVSGHGLENVVLLPGIEFRDGSRVTNALEIGETANDCHDPVRLRIGQGL